MSNFKTSTFQCKINYNLDFTPFLGEISFIVAQCNDHNEDRWSEENVTIEYIREKLLSKFPDINMDEPDDDVPCIEIYDETHDEPIITIFEIEYSKDQFFKDINVNNLIDE